ncbi:hypothetical protein WA171_001829 [Blastocystis sp. BT1]
MEFLQYIREHELLPMAMLQQLCESVKEILIEENTVQPVHSPVNICGDIHGQYSDLLELFSTGGDIPETSYIFMGDYVDRGYNSCATFQLLMSLKLCYPDRITLLRGNHECREITRIYGFYAEIIQKYDSTEPWVWCTDVFDYLGIAALVDNRVLCIHGGLSPDIATIDQIRTLNRLQEVPPTGCYSDLLWSDPDNVDGFQQSPRGAGYLFGEDPVNVFNEVNGLELICRAHQMVQQGFEYMFSKKNLITVWSAPNYCYRCDNVASILQLDEGLNRTMLIFKENKEKQQKESQSGSSFPFFSF